MTEKQAQNIVTQAIAAMSSDRGRYYHLCWWEDRLQCVHVHHTKESHPIFYSAPGQVFADGLSSHQWHLITARLMEFSQNRGVRLTRRSRRRKQEQTAAPWPSLQVTDFDSTRLRALLATARTPGSPVSSHLDRLQGLLEAANTVSSRDVPGDVVTMNSMVRLKDDSGHEMTVSLVFPADAPRDADFEKSKVSVLSPIGLSVLGRRVGDTVEGRVRVSEVLYQPEAAGRFDL